jgi:predicted GH43/DUF377 family glycosyl hydrolase
MIWDYFNRHWASRLMVFALISQCGLPTSRGENADHAIMGYIDGVMASSGGSIALHGWACSQGSAQSIAVDLYVNGPAGSGVYIGRYTANLSSEPAVAQSCQSTGTAYRFLIPLGGILSQHSGQSIYVYGTSTDSALPNAPLGHSGSFIVPGPVALSSGSTRLAIGDHVDSGTGRMKIVDCTIWGNCSNNTPSCPAVGPCSAEASNIFGYAYGPSIVKTKKDIHIFYCSRGGNTGAGSSNAWDAIRYVHSTDGVSWSPSMVKLTASASTPTAAKPAGTRDLAACDPSVVYYGKYYYLYYGSAYVSSSGNTLTVIQVARSPTIGGLYLTYTARNTWEASPADPQMIILPLADIPKSYGAGQPAVIVYNGKLRMWYTDTTVDTSNDGNHVYMLESTDPVRWKPSRSAETDIQSADVDVKSDATSSQFIMYLVKNSKPGLPEIMTSKSSDGMHWSSPIAANMVGPVANYHVDSIGVSSDASGRLVPGESVLIAFGAPYSLGTILPDTSPGMWSLYGSYSSKTRQP